MRKIFLTILSTAFIAGATFAQVDRSKAPKPAPAPKIQLSDYETFTLENGLQVIVVENHKIPQISFQLSVDYVPFLEGENAGNAELAGGLLRSGTANKSKVQIDEEVDFIGATLVTSANGIFGSCLSKHADKFLGIYSDVLLNPTFPEDQLENLRKQTISGIISGKDDANTIASNVAKVLRYGKSHPYGELQTEETVANITQASVKSFYNTYFKPNISYLVIVGDINKAKAQTLAKKYFGSWQKGDVPAAPMPAVAPIEGTQVVFVNKPGAVQSVISVTHPVQLKTGDADAIAASVTNSILGGGIFSGRLMQNLREDKGYTYGARSGLSKDKYVGSFSAGASVRNEVTDSSITEFLFEMKRIGAEPVSQDDISLTKNSMNGTFARSLESPQTIANFALNTAIYNLPADYYSSYLSKLEAVSIADVQAAAKKYIKPNNAYVLVVGNKDIIETLKRFDSDGEITILDANGNPAKLVETKPVPEGVTVSSVLEKYVFAFTQTSDMKSATKKLKKLKDVTFKGGLQVQGMELEMVMYKKAPNMFAMNVMYMGQVAQKQTYNGEKGRSVSMQGAKDMEGEELDQMKVQAMMVPELKYDELGYKTELLGVEAVDGKDAYIMKVVTPSGNEVLDYYSVETGLKIRSQAKAELPSGEEATTITDTKDYKSVEGFMFPYTRVISGPQNLEIKTKEILVNSKLSDSLFN